MTLQNDINSLAQDLIKMHSLQAMKDRLLEDYSQTKDDVREHGNLSLKLTWATALATILQNKFEAKQAKAANQVEVVDAEKAKEILTPDFEFTQPVTLPVLDLHTFQFTEATVNLTPEDEEKIKELVTLTPEDEEKIKELVTLTPEDEEKIKELVTLTPEDEEAIAPTQEEGKTPDSDPKAFLDWAFLEPHQDNSRTAGEIIYLDSSLNDWDSLTPSQKAMWENAAKNEAKLQGLERAFTVAPIQQLPEGRLPQEIEPHQDTELVKPEIKSELSYWDIWQKAYQGAIAQSQAKVKQDYSKVVATVAEVLVSLDKGMRAIAKKIFDKLPQTLKGKAKNFIQERKEKLFAKCKSFADMVKISKFVNNL